MAKLTKSVLDRAEVKDKRYWLWCDELPGFGALVFPSGTKTFYADYYNRDGERKRMSLGPFGKLTVEEARKEARKILGSVLGGSDPALERKTRRTSITVSELCDNYLADVGKGLILKKNGKPKKGSTIEIDTGRVARHIKPLLGKKLVIDVKRSDIVKFIRDVSAGKTALVEATGKLRGKSVVKGGAGTASRTVGLLGGIFSYAVGEGIIETNPVHGVTRPADNKKERRLTPEEYRALGDELEASIGVEAWQGIAGIWILALTGGRLSDTRKLLRTEVDLDGNALRLGDSKTDAQVRPLGRAAADYIRTLPVDPDSPYVLPGVRSVKAPYSVIDDVLDRVTVRAGLTGVTCHVLRHSFASVAGDLDITESTIGAIIGHAGESVTSRYIHRLDVVLVATASDIAGEVYRQMTGKVAAGNVVEFKRSA